MSRTIKQLPKLNPDSDLHDLPDGSRVVLDDLFSDELIYGVVLNSWITEGAVQGITLRRTDQYGNLWLSAPININDGEYVIKEVDGIEV